MKNENESKGEDLFISREVELWMHCCRVFVSSRDRWRSARSMKGHTWVNRTEKVIKARTMVGMSLLDRDACMSPITLPTQLCHTHVPTPLNLHTLPILAIPAIKEIPFTLKACFLPPFSPRRGISRLSLLDQSPTAFSLMSSFFESTVVHFKDNLAFFPHMLI